MARRGAYKFKGKRRSGTSMLKFLIFFRCAPNHGGRAAGLRTHSSESFTVSQKNVIQLLMYQAPKITPKMPGHKKLTEDNQTAHFL